MVIGTVEFASQEKAQVMASGENEGEDGEKLQRLPQGALWVTTRPAVGEKTGFGKGGEDGGEPEHEIDCGGRERGRKRGHCAPMITRKKGKLGCGCLLLGGLEDAEEPTPASYLIPVEGAQEVGRPGQWLEAGANPGAARATTKRR